MFNIFCANRKLHFVLFIPSTEQKPGMIPLHVGSQVYVSKKELIKIFDPKPAIYTCKLAEVIFGQKLKQHRLVGDALEHLDPKKLKALIS